MDFSSSIASQLNAGIIWPEGIVIITLMVVLIGDLIGGRKARIWLPYGAIAGLLMAVVALYLQWDNSDAIAFLGSFNGDNLSIVFRSIVALSSAATILCQ
jgi:NAD(P)H-quinone oxidoreductase subunit 2